MLVLVWCRMSETNYNFVVHTSVRTSRCQLGRTNACGSVFGFYEKVPGPTLKLVPEEGNQAALQIMETGRPRPCVICIAHMASVYRPCMVTLPRVLVEYILSGYQKANISTRCFKLTSTWQHVSNFTRCFRLLGLRALRHSMFSPQPRRNRGRSRPLPTTKLVV